MSYKIAVIGPESSGKTTLVEFISKEFDVVAVEECAREYLLNLDNPTIYSLDDLIEIANIQFDKFERTQSKSNNIIISDTEILTVKIWAEDKFGYCPNEINELFSKQSFDIYLLCKPDIEWKYDILREDKDRRDIIFNIYRNYCIEFKLKYIVIEGDIESRNEFLRKLFKQLNY